MLKWEARSDTREVRTATKSFRPKILEDILEENEISYLREKNDWQGIGLLFHAWLVIFASIIFFTIFIDCSMNYEQFGVNSGTPSSLIFRCFVWPPVLLSVWDYLSRIPKKTRKQKWYSEDLFARFQVLSDTGFIHTNED